MKEIERETAIKNAKLNEGKTKEDFLRQKIAENERLEKLGLNASVEDDKIHCPKCGSTQISADKKGFSMGKAIVGDALAGPIGGAIAGGSDKNKIVITCLKCGHHWKPGK